MAVRDTKLGEREYDRLFAGVTPAALVTAVTVAAGQTLARGTVVVGVPGGEVKAAASALGVAAAAPTTPPAQGGEGKAAVAAETGTPTAYVLAEDVTADKAAVTATAYKTGNFARQALVTDGKYALTDADYEFLRGVGIQTEDTL